MFLIRNSSGEKSSQRIWIDLDNTPHVPFFQPVIEELEARGFSTLVTARDAFQVCQLAEQKGLSYRKVGKHYGKNKVMKIAGLGCRSIQLLPIVAREKPVIGVSHGARSQLLLGNMLGFPTLLLEDYEHAQFPWMMRPTWEMAPEAFLSHDSGKNGDFRYYPGIKEDVYAWRLQPDGAILNELGLDPTRIIATVRPPATEAHYHNPESEILFEKFMERACQNPDVQVVLLPRNQKQLSLLREQFPVWFENNKTTVPQFAVDGMNLIWHSDLVISGGGTMNREAAALGVPVYSIFRGKQGAVDRHLAEQQRLTMIAKGAQVASIAFEKRSRSEAQLSPSRDTLHTIVDTIAELTQKTAASRSGS